jgi:purine-binding chemotaxis protein CheW
MEENNDVALNQYLTFTLAKEQYAVSVSKVMEVLEYTNITKVPRTLDFMRGVINVRGSVIPVIDLRLKFDMEEAERTIDTSIIVMNVNVGDESVTLGTLADSVQEVISLDPSSIEPAPQIGTKINTRFISGIGKQNDRFIIILDIDAVFSDQEIAAVTGEQALAAAKATDA